MIVASLIFFKFLVRNGCVKGRKIKGLDVLIKDDLMIHLNFLESLSV